MKTPMVRLALLALSLFATQLPAQSTTPPPATTYHQVIHRFKANPGQGAELVKLFRDTNMKVWQARINAGHAVSWTLLRSVLPAGEEARADYMVSIMYQGVPPAPDEGRAFEAELKKLGLPHTLVELQARRDAISTYVGSELWRVHARVGNVQKGHYVFINAMTAHDAPAYHTFEMTVWRPVAERVVQDGGMSGWLYATKMLPYGSETGNAVYTADMYPTWEAAFAPRTLAQLFGTVHPNLKVEEVSQQMGQLRTIARSDLWFVVDRAEKSAP